MFNNEFDVRQDFFLNLEHSGKYVTKVIGNLFFGGIIDDG